jgi:hypothetical protein
MKLPQSILHRPRQLFFCRPIGARILTWITNVQQLLIQSQEIIKNGNYIPVGTLNY